MQIISPKATFGIKEHFEHAGTNEVWHTTQEFRGWTDAVTERIDNHLEKLGHNGLPFLPDTELTEEQSLIQWLLNKRLEHVNSMERRLGTPRNEQEAEQAVRNLGALADGRALEL